MLSKESTEAFLQCPPHRTYKRNEPQIESLRLGLFEFSTMPWRYQHCRLSNMMKSMPKPRSFFHVNPSLPTSSLEALNGGHRILLLQFLRPLCCSTTYLRTASETIHEQLLRSLRNVRVSAGRRNAAPGHNL